MALPLDHSRRVRSVLLLSAATSRTVDVDEENGWMKSEILARRSRVALLLLETITWTCERANLLTPCFSITRHRFNGSRDSVFVVNASQQLAPNSTLPLQYLRACVSECHDINCLSPSPAFSFNMGSKIELAKMSRRTGTTTIISTASSCPVRVLGGPSRKHHATAFDELCGVRPLLIIGAKTVSPARDRRATLHHRHVEFHQLLRGWCPGHEDLAHLHEQKDPPGLGQDDNLLRLLSEMIL